MNLQTYEDTLLNGSEGDIRSLADSAPKGSRFEYNAEYESFWLEFGDEGEHMHGLSEVPNCVAVFGESHTF